MTQEQEQNLIDLQRHSALHDARISNLETKFEMFMQSMKDFKNEMRDRDNRRADEIAELRKKNDELNIKIDEKFEKILNQMQSMAIAAVVGVGAIVAAVVSILK